METGNNLESELEAQLSKLCKAGDEFSRTNQFVEAKHKYIEALNLLPGEASQWEPAAWIYAALGDVYFKLGDFPDMLHCFSSVLECPGEMDNPFLRLRLGQAYYELGDREKALRELTQAYAEAGLDVFVQEDPKYLKFLEENADL